MSKLKYYTRKIHRYLGLFIGIQLLLWSLGGLYFSWTDIDEIHGDHLVNFPDTRPVVTSNILSPGTALRSAGIDPEKISEIRLENISGKTYYRVRSGDSFVLIDGITGLKKEPLSRSEAIEYAKKIFKPNDSVKDAILVTKENIKEHWQYRGGALPAWAVSFDHPSNSVVYISSEKGTFEKIRNQQWRIFDYLWMLHIMDFDERENINNIILRVFSVLSLLTVISGFVLFYQSSKTIRTTKKKFKK